VQLIEVAWRTEEIDYDLGILGRTEGKSCSGTELEGQSMRCEDSNRQKQKQMVKHTGEFLYQGAVGSLQQLGTDSLADQQDWIGVGVESWSWSWSWSCEDCRDAGNGNSWGLPAE
jgi:hypothetical protein